MNPAPAIIGALLLIWFGVLVLLVIWRLCNGRDAAAAQRAQMPDDDICTDIIQRGHRIGYSETVFCNEHGMFRLNERGEWVPFDEQRAA